MSNYIYKKVDTLIIDSDLCAIFSNKQNFTQSFKLGENLDYLSNPNQEFFKVFNHEKILMGYVWFEVVKDDLGQYGCSHEIEISFARSLLSKGIDQKCFIDNIFLDLEHIKDLLPEDWFGCTNSVWLGKIEDNNDGHSYISEKLIQHGFEYNLNYAAFIKKV
ncbi:hypothetical protein [Acinetobacter populi]|uniref:GNAT family N-acetyltransferase n=1 Tax=Acinetobacter populi TaxID=1582270 RepID=A0A1Z9YTI0_9GAMM|nr:hypothetical protein [Acinetobacter populi]OUY05507.1 hypothetical protein CAP51_16995 [Acinetobacter populi]